MYWWRYNKACTSKLCFKILSPLSTSNTLLWIQVLNLVVDALTHEDSNVRTAACICLRSVSRSIKVCNMTSCSWSVFCYCCVQLNSHKTSFRIWVQVVLWMKRLFFLWFSFSLISLLLCRYFDCICNFHFSDNYVTLSSF